MSAQRILGTVFAAGIVFFVLVWALTNQFGGYGTINAGGAEIPGNSQSELRALVNRTLDATDGNYDALDVPQGTTLTVGTGNTLLLSGLTVVGTGATSTVQVGYGTTAPADSATAPTSSVTAYSVSLPAAATLHELAPNVTIPAGHIPWVRVIGTDDWNVSGVGWLR